MCGPPDFEALQTCVTRLAELSLAGAVTYSVCKASSLRGKLRPKGDDRRQRASRDLPCGFGAEGSSGQTNT